MRITSFTKTKKLAKDVELGDVVEFDNTFARVSEIDDTNGVVWIYFDSVDSSMVDSGGEKYKPTDSLTVVTEFKKMSDDEIERVTASFMTKVTARYCVAAEKEGAKFSDIPFAEFATPSSPFIQEAKRIRKNGTMNMYVDDAIKKKQSYRQLVKEIKLAIKKHRQYNEQPGSSALHAGVVMSMWHLLDALYGSHPESKE